MKNLNIFTSCYKQFGITIIISLFSLLIAIPAYSTVIPVDVLVPYISMDEWIVEVNLEIGGSPADYWCDSSTAGCSDPSSSTNIIDSWSIYNSGQNLDILFYSNPIKYPETGYFSANFMDVFAGDAFGVGVFITTVPAAPVPEPATMLLLGTGLVGVAGAARRKKKTQA